MTPWGPYHMHQMHHFHRSWHRRPSRLIWFILGGVTATWWAKHKEMRAVEHGERPDHFAWCSSTKYHHHHHHRQEQPEEAPAPPAPAQAQAQYALPPPAQQPPPWQQGQPLPFGWSNQQWEAEKEKMWALGRQAGDSMSDLSEATLENVLSTVEALKAKLAESRAEREAQRKAFEKQLEEEKKEPRHYV